MTYDYAVKYLTTNEAAEDLGVSRRRVLFLIKEGRLPAEMFGRDYMILPKDLEKVRVRKVGRPLGYSPPKKKAATEDQST